MAQTKRVLTDQEIENMVDFITPNKGIPLETALSIINKTKSKIVNQLKKQEIYPELIPVLKKELKENYIKSIIPPGETVGVSCACSIGERNTQSALNSFHKSGISDKSMTTGLPRFTELLNATKDPLNINHKIFFTNKPTSIKEVRNTIGHSILGLMLKDIATSFEVILDKEPEAWYDAFKQLYNDEFTNYKHCITIKLDTKKLFNNKLTAEEIASVIEQEYLDLKCVFSPPIFEQIDIFVNTENIDLPENRLIFIDQENVEQIYLEECVLPNIENIYVCGVPGITEIFYAKLENKDSKTPDEWFIETNSINSKNISSQYSSFKKLLAIDCVDFERTISNNMWDIYETLGIEATRQFMLEEFCEILEGINECHPKLLLDRMLYTGTIQSISRYTIKKDESDILSRCSFEQQFDHLINGGARGEKDSLKSISSAIICGKRGNIGSGSMQLKININQIIKKSNNLAPPIISDNVIERNVEEKTPVIVEPKKTENKTTLYTNSYSTTQNKVTSKLTSKPLSSKTVKFVETDDDDIPEFTE